MTLVISGPWTAEMSTADTFGIGAWLVGTNTMRESRAAMCASWRRADAKGVR